MGAIIVLLTAAVIILVCILIIYKRQIRDICRQLSFLKEHESNLMITKQINGGDIRELADCLNEMIERQRKERRKYLKKEQEISDIYTNLSHDIRTPLTSLNGYFELLRDSEKLEDRQRYLSVIEERIDSLKEMLEELFTYTRLKNETYNLELKELYFERILKETIFSYYDEWEKRGIEPDIQIEETSMKMLGNEQGLKRVVRNIIKNGLDHGQSQICIALRRDGQEAVCLFRNKTERPGDINPDRVFERFYKADQARSKSSAGLGLSIAKEFTTRMNGQIKAFLDAGWFAIEIRFPLLG